MAKRKFNVYDKKVQPSLESYKRDGCKYEIYDGLLNAMANCGKPCRKENKGLCDEHYDYLKSKFNK